MNLFNFPVPTKLINTRCSCDETFFFSKWGCRYISILLNARKVLGICTYISFVFYQKQPIPVLVPGKTYLSLYSSWLEFPSLSLCLEQLGVLWFVLEGMLVLEIKHLYKSKKKHTKQRNWARNLLHAIDVDSMTQWSYSVL